MVARIRILSAALADQIAAGEVVERPASVVKELVENALDAGASRIEVELHGGGIERIRIVDDGHGIHEDDLVLAVTRHATSKIASAEDLVEIHTLGFRGEALASIAAVAHLSVRSRQATADMGTELRCRPGEPPQRRPVGMPVGTQVEVEGLFAALPARRKFLRSEATEVARCSDAVIRVALVHPQVSFRLRHGDRVLVEMAATTADERVGQVLSRRAAGPFARIDGEHEGVRMTAWVTAPAAATRARNGIVVVVRRRVVRESNVARIVEQTLGAMLEPEHHPVACIMVDPPAGTVDVNVHPQKAEVRFRDPQTVFAAVRSVLTTALAQSPDWSPNVSQAGAVVRDPSLASGHGYRLETRALDPAYAREKEALRRQADQIVGPVGEVGQNARAPVEETREPVDRVELIGCLPGPVALFCDGDELLAVDLRLLRSHLLERRLRRDLGGGSLGAQMLLAPIVVHRSRADVELLVGASDRLSALGIVLEGFADDAVLVRAVPSSLRSCLERADIADLLERLMPWLRLDASDADSSVAVRAIAATRGEDPAPRLARRWLAELRADGVVLDDLAGVRRWTGLKLTSAP